MRSLLSSVLVAAALAAPASAQVMGGVNSAPPVVSQSIEMNGQKFSLTYKSITFAGGEWTKRLDNERMRQYINQQADTKPLGEVSISSGLEISGRMVPAGTYDLKFNIDDKKNWFVIMSSGEGEDAKTFRWYLPLQDTEKHRQRMRISVSAGDDDGTCEIEIHFGKQMVSVAASMMEDGGKKNEKKGGDKDEQPAPQK